MPYKIVYDPDKKKRYPHKSKNIQIPVLAVALLLCAAIVLLAGNPVLKPFWRELLIPGDPEITTTAFHGLLENLQAGEGIEESITVFCKEIIDGAS